MILAFVQPKLITSRGKQYESFLTLAIYSRNPETKKLELCVAIDNEAILTKRDIVNLPATSDYYYESFKMDNILALIDKEEDIDIKKMIVAIDNILAKPITMYTLVYTEFDKNDIGIITELVNLKLNEKVINKLLEPISDDTLDRIVNRDEKLQANLEKLAIRYIASKVDREKVIHVEFKEDLSESIYSLLGEEYFTMEGDQTYLVTPKGIRHLISKESLVTPLENLGAVGKKLDTPNGIYSFLNDILTLENTALSTREVINLDSVFRIYNDLTEELNNNKDLKEKEAVEFITSKGYPVNKYMPQRIYALLTKKTSRSKCEVLLNGRLSLTLNQLEKKGYSFSEIDIKENVPATFKDIHANRGTKAYLLKRGKTNFYFSTMSLSSSRQFTQSQIVEVIENFDEYLPENQSYPRSGVDMSLVLRLVYNYFVKTGNEDVNNFNPEMITTNKRERDYFEKLVKPMIEKLEKIK